VGSNPTLSATDLDFAQVIPLHTTGTHLAAVAAGEMTSISIDASPWPFSIRRFR